MKNVNKKYDFNDNIMRVIVSNIRKYRKKIGMTQEELSYYTDLSNEFIRRVETSHGKRGVSVDTLYKISVVLGVRMDQLFEEEQSVEML